VREGIGREEVVVAEVDEEVVGGELRAKGDGVGAATVRRVSMDPKAGKTVTLDEGAGLIARGVIHHENFEVLMCLGREAVEGGLKERRRIIRWDSDSDAW
jgi:hypothetical protein